MKLKRASLAAIRRAASEATDENNTRDIDDSKTIDKEAGRLSAETNVTKKRKRLKSLKCVDNAAINDPEDKKPLNCGDSPVTKDLNIKSSAVSAHKEANVDVTLVGDLCNDRTVYIEGLPYDSTEEDILAFFKSCGQIHSVRLPKWHDSGRLRGYGHVQFSSLESVKLALHLDGCDMKGRYIKIDRPQTPRALSSADKTNDNVLRPAGCRSVFVKNIPYDTTEAEVTETFKVCGPVTSVRLAVWGNTKQLKGFGYVDFKREDSAEIAVKKSGILNLNGRPVIIDFETGAPKKSFRKPDGKVWTKSDSQFSKKKKSQ